MSRLVRHHDSEPGREHDLSGGDCWCEPDVELFEVVDVTEAGIDLEVPHDREERNATAQAYDPVVEAEVHTAEAAGAHGGGAREPGDPQGGGQSGEDARSGDHPADAEGAGGAEELGCPTPADCSCRRKFGYPACGGA